MNNVKVKYNKYPLADMYVHATVLLEMLLPF